MMTIYADKILHAYLWKGHVILFKQGMERPCSKAIEAELSASITLTPTLYSLTLANTLLYYTRFTHLKKWIFFKALSVCSGFKKTMTEQGLFTGLMWGIRQVINPKPSFLICELQGRGLMKLKEGRAGETAQVIKQWPWKWENLNLILGTQTKAECNAGCLQETDRSQGLSSQTT